MNGSLLRIYLAGALALLLTAAGIAGGADEPAVRAALQPATERKPAPEFALKDSAGKVVNLKMYRGKIVLLDFWATWCHGCKAEIPWYIEFQKNYGKSGLNVVGASMDDDGWKVVKPFVETTKVNYPIVLATDELAKQYGLGAMPLSVLIDRKGRIAASHSGVVDRGAWETEIQKLLAEPQ